MDALSADGRELAFEWGSDGGDVVVRSGACIFPFGPGRRGRILGWERLADALPAMVEHSRLVVMHRAAAAVWPAPWSVYATDTAAAWLAQAQPGSSDLTERYRAILLAAEEDGGLTIRLTGRKGVSTLRGELRSRRLIARIAVSARIAYDSDDHVLVGRDIVPDTVAIATGGLHVAEVAEVPWTVGSDIRIASASVDGAGTTLVLREGLRPLVPIPAAARGSAPPEGPPHAPWIVRPDERRALDAVDADAHRVL